ncbi:hypothetical protein GJAV_G00267600 [Gymnothorax javanicus]|nr:hypothetical protein GJAV_G00267600 [Gymnothorax javanicus]
MHVLCITAVLSLLSVSNAESLPCEEVVQPLVLEDFSKVSGKWIVIEAAVDDPKFVALLESVNSAWMRAVPTNDIDTVILHKSMMINGTCVYSTSNLTLSHNTIHFTLDENMTGNSTATILRASADYMVMPGNSFIDGVWVKTFHLFGRTGILSNFDRETYERQRECLAEPKPTFIYDGQQQLCPDKNIHLEESSEGKPQPEKSV